MQVERVQFVAHTGQLLRHAERLGLRLAQRLLPLAKLGLDGLARCLFFLDRTLLVGNGVVCRAQLVGHLGQLRLGVASALLCLGDVFMRLGCLIVKFADAFAAELDSAFEPLQLGLQVGSLFLRLGHLFFDGGALLPGLVNLAFAAGDRLGVVVRFVLKFSDRFFAQLYLVLQIAQLMPGELALKALEFAHELLVPLGLGGLPLERTDLALNLAYGVGNAKQILLGVIELAQCLPLLLFEPRDASGLLEHQAPVVRLAGNELGDVPLRHDAVAGAAHAGAHEKLLNITQPT